MRDRKWLNLIIGTVSGGISISDHAAFLPVRYSRSVSVLMVRLQYPSLIPDRTKSRPAQSAEVSSTILSDMRYIQYSPLKKKRKIWNSRHG